MEVKIGVTDSRRELSFNSAQTPTEVEKLITDALSKDSGVRPRSPMSRSAPPTCGEWASVWERTQLRPGERHV